MPNEHAPRVVRDRELIPWRRNRIHMASVPVQYGYGCLNGDAVELKIVGDRMFLSLVDGGVHMTRHIYNSARSVLFKSAEEVGTLEQAVAAGRAYDFSYPVHVELNGAALDFRTYYQLYRALFRANLELGFVQMNYARPFYAPSDRRKKDQKGREPADFQINGRIYEKTFTVMPMYWPALLAPRAPTFPGLNVLLTQNSVSPAPGTSLIEFKSESAYAPTRGPAVEEKNRFNDRFGKEMPVHDTLLLDYTRQYLQEASGSNLFAVEPNGTISTPPLDGSIFPGLTRDIAMRIIRGEVGQALGFSLSEKEINLATLRELSGKGGELFLTGSALGVIPVKTLVVPKVERPEGLGDYELLSFRVDNGTITTALADCYRCFSVGDGFEVSVPGRGRSQVTEFASYPLLMEIPPSLHAKAKEKFLRSNGSGLPLPSAQILRSGRVRAVPVRENQVETRSGNRSSQRVALRV